MSKKTAGARPRTVRKCSYFLWFGGLLVLCALGMLADWLQHLSTKGLPRPVVKVVPTAPETGRAARVPQGAKVAEDSQGKVEKTTAPKQAAVPEDKPAVPPMRRGANVPQVAASIALHPPKFHHVGAFLASYVNCQAAVDSMSVHLVFSDEEDMKLFKTGLAIIHPHVPSDAYSSVLSNVTASTWPDSLHIKATNAKQVIAAWKKWFGIAHLMDLGAEAPEYGLMLDAEILPNDKLDCGPSSPWYQLIDRVRRKDASKAYPAAQLSKTIKMVPIGDNTFMTGYGYGQGLIKGNADFITHGGCDTRNNVLRCKSPACEEVNRQIQLSLFSWWTDLPYVNLKIAGQMLKALNEKGCPKCYPVKFGERGGDSWRALLQGIRFPRFEYICYQQWCVLHEGYVFRDVTNITGMAKWGSYLEDPQMKGADLAVLEPLWISVETLTKAENGFIQNLSKTAPPLMIFHVDHNSFRFKEVWIEKWKKNVPGFLAQVAFQTMDNTNIAEKRPATPHFSGLSQAQCQQKCLGDTTCKCVLHGHDDSKERGKCWLMPKCTGNHMDVRYNLHVRKPK